MTEFSELMDSIQPREEAWSINVSEDWLQGRTIYGGLGTAICVQTTLRAFPDLPPLRSAQIAFIGPASGELRIKPTILRQGKSTVFVGTDLVGDAGIATRVTLCFGAARPSSVAYEEVPPPQVKAPADCPDFFSNAPARLAFLQHFEGRLAGGHRPFSGAKEPNMLLWLRHRDPALRTSIIPLLALADAPPPAAATLIDKFGTISTMTWSIDMLSETIETDDGWWLLHTTADTAANGYSSQRMTVWNSNGRPTMVSRQNIALFM